MSPSPHRLFLASAGTGKTFQLTNHYLALLLRGVPAERILATTFTRKAAGEILDRVLQRLADAAEGGQGLLDLRQALEQSDAVERPGGEALDLNALDAARCRALLTSLARGLDRFQVRTIDAFFVQVAGLFALDLALPPGWRIGDEREDAALRARALQTVIAEAQPGELIELLRGLLSGGDGRSVQAAMLGQIDHGRGKYLESTAAAWEWLVAPALLAPQELESALRALDELELPRTKKDEPAKAWVKAIAQLRADFAAEDWGALLDKGLLPKVAVQAEKFATYTISDEVFDALSPLLEEARARVASGVVERNRALRSLIRHFEEPYVAAKTAAGKYRFDDLPQLLAAPPAEDGETPGDGPLRERGLDLWFRLDGRIDHLLLDEFQDTAPVQWRILEELAGEILSTGDGERTFFCVGDVKQSIYGWREAEPRLLGNLAERYAPIGLTAERLDKSYRSSRVVLDTVNHVFGSLTGNVALGGEGSEAEAAAAGAWSESYQQHVAAKQLSGAAFLLQTPPAENAAKRDELLLRATVQRVLELRDEGPDATVGVLFRRNQSIPELIHALRLEGVPAAGEGGNPLTDSAAVTAFLALLHLADQPADSAALFHVSVTPFGEHFGLDADMDPLGKPEARLAAGSKVARRVRLRLVHEGYGALASELATVALNSPAWTSWDHLRFGQLVDLAHAFDDSATLRASDFVDEVRTHTVEAPGTGVVRVMTIHKSKGLEFDAVVLPELEGALRGRHVPLLTSRTSPYAAIDAVSTTVPKKRLPAVPVLAGLSARVAGRAVEESLCVLYVGMTRAARRLDLIVSPPNEKLGVPSYADLLRGALAPEELELGEQDAGVGDTPAYRELWSHPENTTDWAAPSESAVAAPEHPDGEGDAPVLRLTPPALVLRAHRPSGEATPKPSELLRTRGAASRGTLVHACLEQLEWLEEFDPSGPRVTAVAERLEPDSNRRAEALDTLRRALEFPAVRDALSRSGDGDLEVRPEHVFTQVHQGAGDEGGETYEEEWNGSIDRLVLSREGGRVVRADVLDYKTDHVTEESLDECVERHRPQLDRYRAAVVAQYDLDPGSVGARLVFLESGDVVDV